MVLLWLEGVGVRAYSGLGNGSERCPCSCLRGSQTTEDFVLEGKGKEIRRSGGQEVRRESWHTCAIGRTVVLVFVGGVEESCACVSYCVRATVVGMAEFLTRSGVVDLRKEGEQVASQVYSSEALDNLDGTPLEAFIRVFVAEQANAEAMERAFHVLAVIGTKHRRFRYRCVGFIGSTMLLDIISQHKNVEAVQRKAMYFLNVLSVDESSRDVLIDAGVAKVLAEVMTANLHSEQVLERACTATSNFALEKGLRKVVMGQQGSIQILMRVATEMSSNPTIVLASLLSIHNLTQECQENTMICRIENVADLVFKTSIRFQKNVQIQGEVAVILTNIVRQDTELKQRICQSTTDLNAVLDMLKLSADSKSLTKHSLELLRRVIDRNGDAIKFVSDQAIMGLLRERIEGKKDSLSFGPKSSGSSSRPT